MDTETAVEIANGKGCLLLLVVAFAAAMTVAALASTGGGADDAPGPAPSATVAAR